MDSLIIYTDGSCLKNPGPGGIGYIIKCNSIIKQKSLGYFNSTNNRMELLASIKALKYIGKKKSLVTLYTDSKYLFLGINYWIYNWVKKQWKNSKNKKIKNYDLWIKLYLLIKKYLFICKWVKGHNNNYYNEKCHKLAKLAALNPTNIDKI